jgi:hypothetical protein
MYTSGVVYYVSSSLGSDANGGLSRLDPKATLASAVTASEALGGLNIITLMDGHAETLTAVQDIAAAVTIVGEGRSDGKPTVKLTNNQAAGIMIDVNASGNDVEFRNIWIEEDAQANSAVRVRTDLARTSFIDCYFECDGNSNAACLQVNTGASALYLKNCTFISTSAAQAAPASNDPPTIALEITAAVAGVKMEGCVFSGGNIGFSDYALKATAAAITNVRIETLSQLLGADVGFHGSSTGFIMPTTTTGACRTDGIG